MSLLNEDDDIIGRDDSKSRDEQVDDDDEETGYIELGRLRGGGTTETF